MSIDNRNLKPGTVLVARYKKADHRCEVVASEEGKVLYRLKDGREFTSPSAAGSAVMGGVACNGWRFWTVAGQGPARKAATTPRTARKAAPKGRGASKAKVSKKGARKPKATKKAKAGNPSKNGAEPAAKPIACGDCGQEFPDTRAAAEHLRDEHGAPEASGTGGR
ncbi:MAG: hypothetical protein U1B78_02590 [Dehalococcoidia bacterium]|nr:hypothetical protein [Dehalococcoidia bacterium]